MAEVLSVKTNPTSIENDDNLDAEVNILNEKEKEVVSEVFEMFSQSLMDRDRPFQYFEGRTLTELIDDCVGRFIANTDARDGIEDWQSRVNVPMTHTKVEAILGKIVAQLPIAQIMPRFDEDTVKADILSDLYNFAEDIDDYDELMICACLEAIVKGTVIGYEGYEHKNRKIREITGENSDGTPKIKETSISENKLYGSIVPLEEFYPSSVSIRRIEDMPYCFRRYIVPYTRFVSEFTCYPRWNKVQGKQSATSQAGAVSNQFYQDYISLNVEDGSVEIIYYYNKDTDEYVLIANGIWLNPLADFSVAPNPFNHKKLPFWAVRFDTLGVDFFYGKSLVDRISSIQDVLNVLTNMALDQSFLTIFPPMLTAGIDPIEEDYLRPGRRVPVDTQGLPLQQAFMKLDMGTPSGWHQFILDYTKNILNEASVDQTSSGQAGVGGRTTAEEIRTAAASVAAILGVFGKLLNTGLKNKAFLKASNILQFWTDSSKPMVSDILGSKKGIFEKAFNVVNIPGAKLSNGKRGKKVVAMYKDNSSLPTGPQIKTTAAINKARNGTEVEIHAITGEYIRSLQFDIKLVPNVKSDETKELSKALILEKARVYMSFPPLAQDLNIKELEAQLAEAFGDDPDKMFNGGQDKQKPPTDNTQNTNGQSVPTEPQGDVANNMVRGAMGGQSGDIQLNNQQ